MTDIDTFFQSLDQPGIGTIWIRMAEVTDWLLLHRQTLETLYREALACGFTCTPEKITRGDQQIHCLRIERAKPCFKPSLPVFRTDTEPSK